MFQNGLSFPFLRLFCFRKRRATKTSDSRANGDLPQTSCAASPPPSEPRRRVSLQHETIDTTTTPSTQRPRSALISFLSPVAHRHSPPLASPDSILRSRTPPPIIAIEQDPPQSILSTPAAPAAPGTIGPQIPANDVSPLEAPPTCSARRVSFQLPTKNPEDRPSTPLSTCSTLVGAQGERESSSAIPPEEPSASETLDSDVVGSATANEAEPIAEILNVVRLETGRVRHVSLFNPQPVRADVSRFSLPVKPTTPIAVAGTNMTDDSRWRSIILPTSGLSSTKKEKRTSRWRREMSKPETQEMLRALRGL